MLCTSVMGGMNGNSHGSPRSPRNLGNADTSSNPATPKSTSGNIKVKNADFIQGYNLMLHCTIHYSSFV